MDHPVTEDQVRGALTALNVLDHCAFKLAWAAHPKQPRDKVPIVYLAFDYPEASNQPALGVPFMKPPYVEDQVQERLQDAVSRYLTRLGVSGVTPEG